MRYETIMIMMMAAIAAASANPAGTGRFSVQAQATVRIVSSVRLRVGAERSEDGRPVRNATIRSDGGRLAAKLVEFE